jgi:hypothetical protein
LLPNDIRPREIEIEKKVEREVNETRRRREEGNREEERGKGKKKRLCNAGYTKLEGTNF